MNALNANGGKAAVHLDARKGIRGNSHFLYSSTRNSLQVADFVSAFLKKYSLDRPVIVDSFSTDSLFV